MCADVMSSAVPPTTPVPHAGPPAATIDDVIARMESIDSSASGGRWRRLL